MRLIWTLIFCFVGVMALLQVALQRGQEFRGIRTEIKSVEREILQEREQINILKADWDILNTPRSLRSLVEKTHLKLYPLEGAQIISSASTIPLHSRYIPVSFPPRRSPDAHGLNTPDIRHTGLASDVREDAETGTTLSNLLRREFSDDDALPQSTEEDGEIFEQAFTEQPFEFESVQALKGDEQ